MSLLLDALKKAADDKKKNLALDDVAEKPANTDESLELELNLDSGMAEPSNDEDFPAVDEASMPQAVIAKFISEKAPQEFSAEKESKNFTDKIIAEDTDEDVATKSIDSSLEKTVKAGKASIKTDKLSTPGLPDESSVISVTGIASTNTEKETVADNNSSTTNKPTTSKANSAFTKGIKTEQALSALINKSNQHSQQEHLKQTITIAAFIALLLIGSGLFFYIKMDTASQEIFIANNNQAPVNRALEPGQQNTRPVISKPERRVEKTLVPEKAATKKATSQTTGKKSTSISILHTKKQDPVSALILEAYNQFYRENYAQANELYMHVILREPNNRDALLGLSAIAIKQQRYEFARQKYLYLLRLNPKDSIAIAGMSSIKNDIDPQLNESQLKFMLKENPDAAHLYFALGSLHASQKKWPEAQSAYFSAWSAENKNADYAYNLAVSLDHLDKRDQALDFYTLSLKLKQASSGNFSSENTSQRIRTLKENNK